MMNQTSTIDNTFWYSIHLSYNSGPYMTKYLLEPQQLDHCVVHNVWYKNYSVTQQCFPMIIKMIIIYIPARQTGPKNQENARFSLLLLLLFWLPQWLSITLCQLGEDRRKLGAKVGLSFVIDTHNRLKIDRPTYLGGALSIFVFLPYGVVRS